MEGLEGLEGLEGFGGCLEGLEGFGGFGSFGAFGSVCALANGLWRKPLLWPWPWGACSGSGLGPGGCLLGTVLRVLEGFGGFGVFAGWQTAALKANRKPLLWPWPWGA